MGDKISIIVNSLLYILNKFEDKKTDSHKLFKILYFAEREHLKLYGRSITDDSYAAMEYGPVPSTGFDIINCSKGKKFDEDYEEASNIFIADYDDFYVSTDKEPDLEWLSKTEIDCLDNSFEDNSVLSFKQLTEKAHDEAWNEAWNDAIHNMDILKIAKSGGANSEMIEYLKSNEEIKNMIG